jgi:hypothetical protein
MRVAFCSCLLIGALSQALADPTKTQTAEFAYRSLGTCLASPEGFNLKMEPVNSGVAWTTTFTGNGRVDAQGAATETGQAVDTASFGVGPRMHAPGAHAYEMTFTATISKSEKDGSPIFRAGAANGTFTAGPYAGRSFSISGFQMTRNTAENAVETYGSIGSPVVQTILLAGGAKIERICVLTLLISGVQGGTH